MTYQTLGWCWGSREQVRSGFSQSPRGGDDDTKAQSSETRRQTGGPAEDPDLVLGSGRLLGVHIHTSTWDRTPSHPVQARNFSNYTVGRGSHRNGTVCGGSVAPPGGRLWNDTLASLVFHLNRCGL